jgi:hypothetical protein
LSARRGGTKAEKVEPQIKDFFPDKNIRGQGGGQLSRREVERISELVNWLIEIATLRSQ